MAKDQAEFRLTCLVADLFRLASAPGVHTFHVPNGEYRSARTGARLKRMGVIAGEPDFVIFSKEHKGKIIGLELKAEGGRQTPEQREVERQWTLAGGLYKVCRGYQETFEFLSMLGVLNVVNELRSIPKEREPA